MKASHRIETWLVRGMIAIVRAMSWRHSLALGAGIGDLAHALGLRRKVAEANLAGAMPELSADARAEVLRRHYRHLGQAACECARLAELSKSPEGEVIAAVRGYPHIDAARQGGRGVIMVGGHYGSIELLGGRVAQSYPVDAVAQSMSNPGVDEIHWRLVRDAGMGLIPLGAGTRRVFASLRANRLVALLADQDARDDGVFVPFLGRMTSTPTGPAAISIRTGAPIVMAFITRREDGRHDIDVLPPLYPPANPGPDAVRELTARHVACLEEWVRKHPEMWFWLHRRWKTSPPESVVAAAAAGLPAGLPGGTQAV